ncbi:terminase large subunit domain-containing protein [Aminobacter aganoensis]|uniref:Phage terminase large subunit-like protein n=1 Tax=Aminobacter aganoensis TaxID=83264 RepID=A0A7X0KJX9_9HYPH|nr:terminase family protein [Aminobacter aganoensis]MBB6353490.1 phage terminase large subunit-like protein [Aminobacter aganoensis]
MLSLTPEALRALPRERKEVIAAILAEKQKRQSQRMFHTLFPDEDTIQPDGRIIHARHKYAKHMEFFRAGAEYRERCFLAANRVGKTVAGGYEVSAHLTGLYPDWWEGRRFDGPIRAWACGKTNESTRDVVQKALLGEITFEGQRKTVTGTGLLPGRLIGLPSWKQGVQDLVDTIKVRHVSGKWSTLGFKSYQQGRGAFEGTAQHVIWPDEECPIDVYGECLTRTATTNGLILLTFTPLEGLTQTVLAFMPNEDRPAEFERK